MLSTEINQEHITHDNTNEDNNPIENSDVVSSKGNESDKESSEEEFDQSMFDYVKSKMSEKSEYNILNVNKINKDNERTSTGISTNIEIKNTKFKNNISSHKFKKFNMASATHTLNHSALNRRIFNPRLPAWNEYYKNNNLKN